MVVDDHDLFRSGLRRLLENATGLHVVAEARRGDEAVRLAIELRPDVVLMDTHMPGLSGVEATRAIRDASPPIAVLMLTLADDPDEVLAAVLAGASGYLLKDAKLPEIIAAIHAANAGHAMIAPRVAALLLALLRRHVPREERRRVDFDLDARELAVLKLLVAGCDNGEIGRRLHVSSSTVKLRITGILGKLGVANRIQAAVLAVRRGLVDD